MKELLYDGSFPGFLTVLGKALTEKGEIRIWSEDEYRPSLFGTAQKVKADLDFALEFKKKLVFDFSEPVYRPVLYAYLAEEEGTGNLVFDFLHKLKRKEAVFSHRVGKLCQGVTREKVRMLGFVRFRKVEPGYLYASVRPKYNIIGLLAPHFASRQANHQWVIHDLDREMAVLGREKDWEIKPLPPIKFPEDIAEEEIQKLWREHFKALSVPGRINRKRQNNLVPRRYWPHLTEKG